MGRPSRVFASRSVSTFGCGKMKSSFSALVSRRAPRLLVALLLASAVVGFFLRYNAKPNGELFYFEVQRGVAADSVREVARQAKVAFLLSSDSVGKVETEAVAGFYTPLGAFEALLENTPLVVVRHEQSGVYLVRRTQ